MTYCITFILWLKCWFICFWDIILLWVVISIWGGLCGADYAPGLSATRANLKVWKDKNTFSKRIFPKKVFLKKVLVSNNSLYKKKNNLKIFLDKSFPTKVFQTKNFTRKIDSIISVSVCLFFFIKHSDWIIRITQAVTQFRDKYVH